MIVQHSIKEQTLNYKRVRENDMNQIAIEVDNLKKTLGSSKAIDSVSFTVRRSSISTILGPSGCGKTTTLRCIAGLVKPDSGRIQIDGTTVFSDEEQIDIPPERRGIGMVFQSYALWPHMAVYENVAFPQKVKKIPRERIATSVAEVLKLVGLEGLETRFPFELSGGQQQRVALARALISKPNVLLLDEPLSGIDAKQREQLRIELKEIQRRINTTFVYVTHDQAEAFALSDNVLIMNQGKLVEEGTPEQLYENPASQFTAEFFGSANILKGIVHKATSIISLDDIEVKTAREVAIEGEGFISIRPEDIQLLSVLDAPRTSNSFIARIIKSVYTGAGRQYWITIDDNEKLTLQVTTPKDFVLENRSKVVAHIPPERVNPLERN